jgi:hypothetical protein
MDFVGLVVFVGNKASRTLRSSMWRWNAALSKKKENILVMLLYALTENC